ncbi:MAG: hypothetical protein LQ350_001712 [Teloschistes chrysophthalmus]|nr:MAG: hypothetical protein LQ350_001712 [Niorma chrysophthalma]
MVLRREHGERRTTRVTPEKRTSRYEEEVVVVGEEEDESPASWSPERRERREKRATYPCPSRRFRRFPDPPFPPEHRFLSRATRGAGFRVGEVFRHGLQRKRLIPCSQLGSPFNGSDDGAILNHNNYASPYSSTSRVDDVSLRDSDCGEPIGGGYWNGDYWACEECDEEFSHDELMDWKCGHTIGLFDTEGFDPETGYLDYSPSKLRQSKWTALDPLRSTRVRFRSRLAFYTVGRLNQVSLLRNRQSRAQKAELTAKRETTLLRRPSTLRPAQCRGLAENLLEKDAACVLAPCSFRGVHQPSLVKTFAREDIYIFSYVYDPTFPQGMTERVCEGEKEGVWELSESVGEERGGDGGVEGGAGVLSGLELDGCVAACRV